MEMAKKVIDQTVEKDGKGYICVTGVHGVIEAQKDPEFSAILNKATLCTPDGMPLVWIGRYYGFKHMGRVYGPDLMLEVCKMSLNKNYKHFLYGGAKGVAAQLKQRLIHKFPEINIVGIYTPPFRPISCKEEEELCCLVRKTQPDIFWVGLSTPKQEKFMANYINKLDTKIMIGVGAAFDFHTGRVKQAPRWIQRRGLEWLFRLSQEPHRLWRRYIYNNPVFVYKIISQLMGIKNYDVH